MSKTGSVSRLGGRVVFYYFNEKSFGESCRTLMVYGGQEFEDRRIAWEDWPKFKENTLFGSLPLLEIDGKKYAQSLAISRYLGSKYGLIGDTLEDALEIDQNVSLLNDLLMKGVEVHYEKDKVLQATKYAEFGKNVFPKFLETLNAIVVKNNGHLALGKLTWGDFVFAGVFEYLRKVVRIPDLGQKYPAFQKIHDTVYSIPSVKAFDDSIRERES